MSGETNQPSADDILAAISLATVVAADSETSVALIDTILDHVEDRRETETSRAILLDAVIICEAKVRMGSAGEESAGGEVAP